MSSTTDHTSHTTEADNRKLREDLAQLRQDFAALKDDVGHRSRDQIRTGMHKARDRFGDVGDEIQSRPLTSIATAFGIGLLLGKLIGR